MNPAYSGRVMLLVALCILVSMVTVLRLSSSNPPQFRFAKPLDVLMILVGTVMALAAGAALPVHIYLFGRVINQFVYYSTAIDVRNDGILDSLDTLNSDSCGNQNFSCGTFINLVRNNSLDAFVNVSCPDENITKPERATEVHFCGNVSGSDVFGNVLDFVCDPKDTFLDEITMFAYIYVSLATGVLFSMFLAFFLWNVSGYRQARRMRLAFYRSILKQDIGWFDVTEAAQLSTRLAE